MSEREREGGRERENNREWMKSAGDIGGWSRD